MLAFNDGNNTKGKKVRFYLTQDITKSYQMPPQECMAEGTRTLEEMVGSFFINGGLTFL